MIDVITHMIFYNLIDPRQFGFTSGRGTISSLALSYEFIARKLSQKNMKISVVARDVSGAFDRVWHRGLIMLLTRLNLPLLFVKTMSNFLTERSISIKILDYIGPNFTMQAGVPQGAPDSALLFNISILPFDFNFQNISQFCYSSWYADDNHQIVAFKNQNRFGHLYHIKKAINIQTKFEKSRGVITSADKSLIIPICQNHFPG